MAEELEDFGLFDFGDEKLEQPISDLDKDKEEDENKDDELDKDKKEDVDKDLDDDDNDDDELDDNKSEGEENEDDNELDDNSIIEKYGDDVNPTIVRHYEAIKDNLLLNEDFEFNGKNIEDAYDQDLKNRNNAIAQNLIDKLPEKAKNILSYVLKSKEDISSESFDKILQISKNDLEYDFETEDENKNIENAKSFLTSIYKEKGLKDRVIKTMLEDLEDEDKLISEALEEKEIKDNINSKLKQDVIDADNKAKEEEKKRIKSFKSEIDKELDNLKYSKEKTKEIKDVIFTIDENTKQSKAITILQKIWSNPKALITLSEIIGGYDEKTGEIKLQRLENKIKSDKNKEIKTTLEEKLTGNGFKNKSESRKNTTNIDWNDIEIVA